MYSMRQQTQYKLFLRLMAQKGILPNGDVEKMIEIISSKGIRFKEISQTEFASLLLDADSRSNFSNGENLLFASEVLKQVVSLDPTPAQHDKIDGFVTIGNYADGRVNESTIMMVYSLLARIDS